MAHSSPHAPDPSSPDPATLWRRLKLVQRFVTIGTWTLCASLVWAGLRAVSSGAGVTVLLIALAVCVVASLGLPHVHRSVFRHVTAQHGDVDDEWRRFDSR
jgi:amino acid permease